MMLRYRMNKLIRMLEKDDSASLSAAIQSGEYLKALMALEDEGCIKAVKDMGDNYIHVWLLDHYATYQLSRQDVWSNRLWGFLFGVATSVMTAFITGILHI